MTDLTTLVLYSALLVAVQLIVESAGGVLLGAVQPLKRP